MIPVYKPYLTKQSENYIVDAITSSWISSIGKYKIIVEEKLKDLLNVKFVLLTNNGTSACHLVSRGLYYSNSNIKKIICPNLVYVAAWNGFLFDKNFNLEIRDVNIDTWNLDYNNCRAVENEALLVVHNIGNIVNVPEIKKQYHGIIIEDNCEGFLGKYDGYCSGTKSLISSISFFGNKNITCGEGGAVITNNEDIFNYINCIHGQGQSETKFLHNELGYNYRMTNVAAAILLGQLEVLPEILEKKDKLFKYYRKHLSVYENIKFQNICDNTQHSHWMMGIRKIGNKNYKDVEKYFNKCGIETRPMFYPASSHKYLNNNKNVNIISEENSKILHNECFIIPSFPDISDDERKYIVQCIGKFVRKL